MKVLRRIWSIKHEGQCTAVVKDRDSAVRQTRHEFKTQLWCLLAGKDLLETYFTYLSPFSREIVAMDSCIHSQRMRTK